MSSVEIYEPTQPTTSEPVLPEGREGRDAEIIPFPVKAGVGEVAVGASAESNEGENLPEPTAVGSEIAVHQGFGSARYLTRRTQTPSALPNSHEYNMRAKDLHNKERIL